MKNKRITVIVGLPGSGKSYLGQHLAEKTGGLFVDNVDKNGGCEVIANAIRDGVNYIVLADPNLCNRETQNNARKFLRFTAGHHGYGISWLYFENDVQKCLNNVAHRADGRDVNGAVKLWSNLYHIPEDADVLSVWQPGDEQDRFLDKFGVRLAECCVCGTQLGSVEITLCQKNRDKRMVCLQHMSETLEQSEV